MKQRIGASTERAPARPWFVRPLSVAERKPPGRPGPSAADAAVAELYAAHWTGLVRLAWLLLHDDQGAEEVVQDAFIAVHRRWDSLRNPDSAAAYLRRPWSTGHAPTCGIAASRSAIWRAWRGAHRRIARRTEVSAEDRALDVEATQSMIVALGRLPQRQERS